MPVEGIQITKLAKSLIELLIKCGIADNLPPDPPDDPYSDEYSEWLKNHEFGDDALWQDDAALDRFAEALTLAEKYTPNDVKTHRAEIVVSILNIPAIERYAAPVEFLLAIDSSYCEVQYVAGLHSAQPSRAEQHFRRAIELDPLEVKYRLAIVAQYLSGYSSRYRTRYDVKCGINWTGLPLSASSDIENTWRFFVYSDHRSKSFGAKRRALNRFIGAFDQAVQGYILAINDYEAEYGWMEAKQTFDVMCQLIEQSILNIDYVQEHGFLMDIDQISDFATQAEVWFYDECLEGYYFRGTLNALLGRTDAATTDLNRYEETCAEICRVGLAALAQKETIAFDANDYEWLAYYYVQIDAIIAPMPLEVAFSLSPDQFESAQMRLAQHHEQTKQSGSTRDGVMFTLSVDEYALIERAITAIQRRTTVMPGNFRKRLQLQQTKQELRHYIETSISWLTKRIDNHREHDRNIGLLRTAREHRAKLYEATHDVELATADQTAADQLKLKEIQADQSDDIGF